MQVKPLLQVTRQDEEIQAREAQLQKAKDNLTRAEQNYTDLDRKHAQVTKPPHCCVAFPTLGYELMSRSSSFSFLCHILAVGGEGSAG